MAVYKRPGSPHWHIEFQFQGRRIRQSSHTESKREAQELERRMRGEAHKQIVMGDVAPMTFGQALDRYFATVILPKGNKAAATRDLYVMRALRKAFGPDTPLPKLAAPVIAAYQERLLADGKAASTVNRHLAIVRATLRLAQSKWGTLAAVPKIGLHKLNNQRYRFLSPEEERGLLNACPPHLHDLVVFLTETGARKTEATGLTWGDVDLEGKLVKFMDTKSDKPRGVPLTQRARELLERLWKNRPEGQERVFLRRNAARPTAAKPFDEPYGAWDTARRKAGLSDVHMHDLRHTFASRLVQAGVPLFEVGKLLGHADMKMTQRYAHLAPGTLGTAIDLLDAWRNRQEKRQAGGGQDGDGN